MKLVKGMIILIVVMLAISAFLPVTSAQRDSLRVIMTAGDKVYQVGDTIQVEVRVYEKGVLTDADDVDVTLDTRWQHTDIQITMLHVSTGVYQGSYQILEDDHHAWFYAYAFKGNDSDEAELGISIYRDEFELSIHFCHQTRAYAWPDDSITATINARYRGELVDVDNFNYVRLITPYDQEIQLSHARVSTGTYEATYTFTNITENGNYELGAHATYANAHADAHAYITVNVMSVWYNLDSMAGNTATFTLGVADQKGKGVPNAMITITYPQEVAGLTNEEGMAIFSLTGVWNGARVYGHVTSYELYQAFEGYIYTTDPDGTPNPSHHSFDVIYEGSEYVYAAGESITRNYKAYNCTVPLQNKNIYYYVTLEGMDFWVVDGFLETVGGSHVDGTVKVIKTGSVTTSEFGDISINFKAPSAQGQVNVHFESGIPRHSNNYNVHWQPDYDIDDGLVYEDDVDAFFISKGDLWNSQSIDIESDPLKVGGKTKVTIETSQSLGVGDVLFAQWMPGKPSSGIYSADFESEWVCWVEGANVIFLEKNGGKEFEGYTIIPDFMSKDGDFTIVAGNVDGATGYPDVNHVSVKEGERASTKDSGLMSVLLLVLAFAIVVIVITALALRDKKGGKSPYSEEEYVPEEAYLSEPEQPSLPPDGPVHPMEHQLPPETMQQSAEDLPPPPPDIPPPPPLDDEL